MKTPQKQRRSRPSSNPAPSSNVEQEIEPTQVHDYDSAVRQLEMYYGIVKRQILHNQSPTTGLFPVVSSDTKIGSVRDTIYCAAAMWALYQSFRRIDDDHGKSYILGQSAVKSMRGILVCWILQAGRVEAFKKNQGPQNSLHSKFDLVTGDMIHHDDEYFHLQIDTVSLWLLFLVQMISSDLQIIYTQDEIAFVQNLVYYVERAYRTPDYGMWERGSKYNDGTPEIHASSIGMAKAALEAINGFNLFGNKGAAWSVIYVDIDAHNRNRSIFETMLPRESSSKNIDASLLPTVSFPAFATHDDVLYGVTKSKIVRKLRGSYGFKRFLRDGYKTVLEDTSRRFYYDGETKEFEHIECEWPLFYIYMIIDGVFKSLPDQVEEYRGLLSNRLKVDHNGDPIVPMYFYVAADSLDREKRNPGSQLRYGSKEGSPDNIFLWGQSLYIISELLTNHLLSVTELDLMRRYLPSFVRPKAGGRYSAFQSVAPDLVVQVSLIAESMRLQAMMATYGIRTQTPHEIEPVQIWPPSELVKVYENLGVNNKLGLKGRPPRPVGALGTAKIYRVFGQTVLCYPLILEVSDFYLSHDMTILIDDIKNDIHFIGRYWRLSGRPTYCILIREEHMRDPKFREFLGLLAQLKCGSCSGQKVQLGRLQNMIASSCIEHLDFMNASDSLELDIQPFIQLVHEYTGFQSLTDIPKIIKYNEPSADFSDYIHKPNHEVIDAFKYTTTLNGKSHLLGILLSREGPSFQIDGVAVEDHMKHLTRQAGAMRLWATVRYCSSLLQHMVDSISPYITTVLVNGKQITVGVVGQEEVVLGKPMTPKEIHEVLYSRVQPVNVYQAVLQQEVIVHVGQLMTTNPDLFNGIRKIRVGWILHAVDLYMKMGFVEDPQPLECYGPSELRTFLNKIFKIREWAVDNTLTPYQKRQLEGCLGRVPDNFYQMVWTILKRTAEGISVADYHLPQQPTISNMTMSELNFALLVEMTLNRIAKPEYRQIMVELLCVVSTILQRNPELNFEKRVDLDKLLNEALRMFQKDSHQDKNDDMTAFFNLPVPVTIGYLARAVVNHMLQGEMRAALGGEENFCTVS